MAFCSKCGAQIQEGKKFCASCGAAAPTGTAPAQPNQQFQQTQSYQQPQQPQYQQPPYQQSQQDFQRGIDQLGNLARNTTDETGSIDPADIEKNKAMGGLAYFLFFLPLIACPESKYGRFHANQGLVYLLLCAAGGILLSIVSAILTWRLWWLSSILSLAVWVPVLALGIIGLINGFSGKAKELPVIGKIRLIK